VCLPHGRGRVHGRDGRRRPPGGRRHDLHASQQRRAQLRSMRDRVHTRAGVQRRRVRDELRLRARTMRELVRRSDHGRSQLWLLRCHLRGWPRLQWWDVRVCDGSHRLRGRLRRPRIEPRELRDVRDGLRRRRGLCERTMPVTDALVHGHIGGALS